MRKNVNDRELGVGESFQVSYNDGRMATLDILITEFLEHLEIEKGRSSKTVRNYDFYLRRFVAWSGCKMLKDVTSDIIRQFRLHLNRAVKGREDATLKANTQNYHLIALRSFLKYCAKRDLVCLPPEKIELAKHPARQVQFLEGDELSRMLVAATKTPGIVSLRDTAILQTLFSTGLRVSELANLKIENVNLKRDEFTVRGKGGKVRVVFLSDGSREALKAYIEARTDTSPFLFVSHDRAKNGRESAGALTPRSIQRLVQRYARAAGVTKKITPHTLRHTFATDLLRNGADIRSVQSMLGHASITTTQVYTHVTDKQLREIHKKFHGKS